MLPAPDSCTFFFVPAKCLEVNNDEEESPSVLNPCELGLLQLGALSWYGSLLKADRQNETSLKFKTIALCLFVAISDLEVQSLSKLHTIL